MKCISITAQLYLNIKNTTSKDLEFSYITMMANISKLKTWGYVVWPRIGDISVGIKSLTMIDSKARELEKKQCMTLQKDSIGFVN